MIKNSNSIVFFKKRTFQFYLKLDNNVANHINHKILVKNEMCSYLIPSSLPIGRVNIFFPSSYIRTHNLEKHQSYLQKANVQDMDNRSQGHS